MHLLPLQALLGILVATVTSSRSTRPNVYPVGLAVSSKPESKVSTFREFQLSPYAPVATLDYGFEKAGYPFFDVKSHSGRVQIEIKYSEAFPGLNTNFSDGPIVYAPGLSNTFRVETFDIVHAGRIDAFFLQGGQRWQSIRLLTNGTVTFKSVGLRSTTPNYDEQALPGAFTSSDETFNNIWGLGARAVALSCLEKGTQGPLWEFSSNGAFVRGMRPALSSRGAFFKDYTLQFSTKIVHGGIAWSVAKPLASPARGLELHLVSSGTGFVNANHTLLPRNTVVLGYGFSLVNATTLPSYYLGSFEVPFEVKENEWHSIETALTGGTHLAMSVNGYQIFNVSLADYYVGGQKILTAGSFGFGGWQDNSGYIRNVKAWDSVNKTVLYENSLTDDVAVSTEYGVHENFESVCLDGPKRDRLVWLGDFYHTVRVLGASTSRYDIAKSTLQWFLDWQIDLCVLPYAPPMGYSPTDALLAYAYGGGGQLSGYPVWVIILSDYQILGLLSFCEYVRLSGDVAFARETWTQWKLLSSWILGQINATTGLPSLVGGFLGPSTGGSAISCVTLRAINAMANVASAVGDTAASIEYQTAAKSLSQNINDRLWNAALGTYSLSIASPDDFSVNSIAFCILSGAANATQASSSISALSQLKLGPGYKDSTLVSEADPSIMISPNTNGFLLEALAAQNESILMKQLMKSLWVPMTSNPESFTGASWEYVSVAGEPGYGLYTSLGHPWGGAPTYILPEYVTGIRTAPGPDGYGYRHWILQPKIGLDMGLKEAYGQSKTMFDAPLKVQWKVMGPMLEVSIEAPCESSGVFTLGKERKVLTGQSKYKFKVKL